ncbi:rhomboid family intramembrane serine protease [Amaricoccus sp.]|uniref:rhomboid family intramembrane serine protease n=1 Tax=Amaricoccus sp. TaxID=1872485 RepID=UPI00260A6972|nr:rhomboid family intramembrane serine protease [uncultured Amaricoccus sp.]
MTVPERKPYVHKPLPRSLLTLFFVIAGVELLLTAADAGYVFDPSLRMRVLRSGAFWASLLHGAQPLYQAQPVTMFLSHALLHGGFLHMAMNMAVLLALGRFVGDRYGAGTILPIFFVGAVAGGAAFGLLSSSPAPMVGASGAVFAFLGVWTVWDYRRHRAAGVPASPVWRRVLVLIGINVVMYVGLGGMLAWEAHLGGFLAGLGYGVVLENRHAAALRSRADSRRATAENNGSAD